jgi:hypothetical protein
MSVQYNKVTPIYQCIDNGNFKGAVKLCQKKDVDKWDITKALMAYCLSQLNKKEEALAVALEVMVIPWLILVVCVLCIIEVCACDLFSVGQPNNRRRGLECIDVDLERIGTT